MKPISVLFFCSPSSPVPGGYLIGGRASSRNWPGSKLPLVDFHGSVRSTFASSQSPLKFTSAKGESSRRSLARPSPQRATARRGPHKPAALGFGLFCHVQTYCQAGVFPKRGYATSSRTRASSGLMSSPLTPRCARPSPQRATARRGPHRLPSPGVTS